MTKKEQINGILNRGEFVGGNDDSGNKVIIYEYFEGYFYIRFMGKCGNWYSSKEDSVNISKLTNIHPIPRGGEEKVETVIPVSDGGKIKKLLCKCILDNYGKRIGKKCNACEEWFNPQTKPQERKVERLPLRLIVNLNADKINSLIRDNEEQGRRIKKTDRILVGTMEEMNKMMKRLIKLEKHYSEHLEK